MRIPITKPSLGEKEVAAVRETILSGWVTQGPRVKAFEEAFARSVGARKAVAVSSCTAALHLALRAVGVSMGDVVLTVSQSFIATANAVRHCGAEPVFVDIDPDTLNMSAADLERTLRERFDSRDGGYWLSDLEALAACAESPLNRVAAPKGRLAAVLAVHQIGNPVDMATLMAVVKRYNVPVVEDAACAVGSELSLDGGATFQPVGKPVGEAACFSFHPRKVITTGDGGMITIDCERLESRLRMERQHGMEISDINRHTSSSVIFESYTTTAYNYRMTDIQAAMGLVQLGRLPGIIARRRELATRYHEELAGVGGFTILEEPTYARYNWQSYTVFLDDPAFQKPVMQKLLNRGIALRRSVMCAHREAPYQVAWPEGTLPASERAASTGLILPLFPSMTDEQVREVADELRKAVAAL